MSIKSGTRIGLPSLPVKVLNRFASGEIQNTTFSSSVVDPVFRSDPDLWDVITSASGGYMAVKGIHQLYVNDSVSSFLSIIEAQYRTAGGSSATDREVRRVTIDDGGSALCRYISDTVNIAIPLRDGSLYLERIKAVTGLQPVSGCTVPAKGRHFANFEYFISAII